MVRPVLLMLVVACGSNPAPVQTTVSNRPAPVAAATCADVGSILRGPVEVADPKAGPAREAAIAKTCGTEHWSPQVIACVTGGPRPTACLSQLTSRQSAAWDASLEAWSAQYEVSGEPGGGRGHAQAGDGAGSATGSGVPACDHYGAVVTKLQGCDQMPEAARAAILDAFHQASAGWSSIPANDRKNLATACQAGADAIQQTGAALCGW